MTGNIEIKDTIRRTMKDGCVPARVLGSDTWDDTLWICLKCGGYVYAVHRKRHLTNLCEKYTAQYGWSIGKKMMDRVDVSLPWDDFIVLLHHMWNIR